MQLVQFTTNGAGMSPKVGVLGSDVGDVIDVASASRSYLIERGCSPDAAQTASNTLCCDMRAVVGLGELGKSFIGEVSTHVRRSPSASDQCHHRLEDVTLLAPLQPANLRCCSLFEGHVTAALAAFGEKELAEAWYESPTYYKGNPFTVCGPGSTVSAPGGCEVLDYEVELGIVVSPGGTNILASDAAQHIYGFTIINDFSARDFQRRDMSVGFGPMKSKDFATGLGPAVTTADEITNLADLRAHVYVNGTVWASLTCSGMRWSPEEVLEYCSRDDFVAAGEVIASGALEGGSGLELGRSLSSGDLVEIEVEGLGKLAHRVIVGGAVNPG